MKKMYHIPGIYFIIGLLITIVPSFSDIPYNEICYAIGPTFILISIVQCIYLLLSKTEE